MHDKGGEDQIEASDVEGRWFVEVPTSNRPRPQGDANVPVNSMVVSHARVDPRGRVRNIDDGASSAHFRSRPSRINHPDCTRLGGEVSNARRQSIGVAFFPFIAIQLSAAVREGAPASRRLNDQISKTAGRNSRETLAGLVADAAQPSFHAARLLCSPARSAGACRRVATMWSAGRITTKRGRVTAS